MFPPGQRTKSDLTAPSLCRGDRAFGASERTTVMLMLKGAALPLADVSKRTKAWRKWTHDE